MSESATKESDIAKPTDSKQSHEVKPSSTKESHVIGTKNTKEFNDEDSVATHEADTSDSVEYHLALPAERHESHVTESDEMGDASHITDDKQLQEIWPVDKCHSSGGQVGTVMMSSDELDNQNHEGGTSKQNSSLVESVVQNTQIDGFIKHSISDQSDVCDIQLGDRSRQKVIDDELDRHNLNTGESQADRFGASNDITVDRHNLNTDDSQEDHFDASKTVTAVDRRNIKTEVVKMQDYQYISSNIQSEEWKKPVVQDDVVKQKSYIDEIAVDSTNYLRYPQITGHLDNQLTTSHTSPFQNTQPTFAEDQVVDLINGLYQVDPCTMSSLDESTLISSSNKQSVSISLDESALTSSSNNQTALPSLDESTFTSLSTKHTVLPSLDESTLTSSSNKQTVLPLLDVSTLTSSSNKQTVLPSLHESTLTSSSNKQTVLPSLDESTLTSSIDKQTVLPSLDESTLTSSNNKHTVIYRNVKVKPSPTDNTKTHAVHPWRISLKHNSLSSESSQDQDTYTTLSVKEAAEKATREAEQSAAEDSERSENLRLLSLSTDLKNSLTSDELSASPITPGADNWYTGHHCVHTWESKGIYRFGDNLQSMKKKPKIHHRARNEYELNDNESEIKLYFERKKIVKNSHSDGHTDQTIGHDEIERGDLARLPSLSSLFPEDSLEDSLVFPLLGLTSGSSWPDVETELPKIILTTERDDEHVLHGDASDADRLSREVALSVLNDDQETEAGGSTVKENLQNMSYVDACSSQNLSSHLNVTKTTKDAAVQTTESDNVSVGNSSDDSTASKNVCIDAESQVEDVDDEDRKLRQRHLEILALAHEIMARSRSSCEHIDSIDPGLVEEWNRDRPVMMKPEHSTPGSVSQYTSGEGRANNRLENQIKSASSYKELCDELQQHDTGGELSYRREESIVQFPVVIFKGARSALLVPYGQSLQEPSECIPVHDSFGNVSPGASKIELGGEIGFMRDEKLPGGYTSFIQPLRPVESGSTIVFSDSNKKMTVDKQEHSASPELDQVGLSDTDTTSKENKEAETSKKGEARYSSQSLQTDGHDYIRQVFSGHDSVRTPLHPLNDNDSSDQDSYDRERSPLSRRHYYGHHLTISNDQILNEIEKLKSEHSKMMNLLERSREKKYKKQKALLEISKGSPSQYLESDSSSGDSPVTVIPRHGSAPGSTGISPIGEAITSSSPPVIVEDGPSISVGEVKTLRPIGLKDGMANTDPGSAFSRQRGQRSAHKTSSVSTNTDTVSGLLKSESVHSSSQTIGVNLVDRGSGGRPSGTDLQTENFSGQFNMSSSDQKGSKQHQQREESRTTAYVRGVKNFGRGDLEQYYDFLLGPLEIKSEDSTGHEDSSSTISSGSTLSPLALQAILDDDVDSAFSMSSLNTGRPMVSTGVEVCVDNLDDSTQTDFVRFAHSGTGSYPDSVQGLNLSNSSDRDSMSTIHRQLDKLHNERIEIIELLSLKYLPASLTIELLEAKLNYCIGQTDYLLATLEDGWDDQEPWPRPSKTLIKVTKEYLKEYKTQLSQSKKDIESCLETHTRKNGGLRGRRRTKGTDLLSMRRRAEIEAFKLERLREQYRHEREKASPLRHHLSSSSESLHTSGSQTNSSLKSMTPTQRREYLVSLRREIVNSSDVHQHRHHSLSPRSSHTGSSWTVRSSSLSPHRPDTFSPHHVPDLTLRRIPPSHDNYHHTSSSHIDEALRHLTTDLRTNVVASYSSKNLNPDRLIEESNEIRRQNQIQIEKAQEVLRELDERRQTSSRKSFSSKNGTKTHTFFPAPQAQSTPDHRMSSSVMKNTVTRSSSPSFVEYARDHLVRGQRRIQTSSPHNVSVSGHHSLARLSHMTPPHKCPHRHSPLVSGTWSLNSSPSQYQQQLSSTTAYCPHDTSTSYQLHPSRASPTRGHAASANSSTTCPHLSSSSSLSSSQCRSWSNSSFTCPHVAPEADLSSDLSGERKSTLYHQPPKISQTDSLQFSPVTKPLEGHKEQEMKPQSGHSTGEVDRQSGVSVPPSDSTTDREILPPTPDDKRNTAETTEFN